MVSFELIAEINKAHWRQFGHVELGFVNNGQKQKSSKPPPSCLDSQYILAAIDPCTALASQPSISGRALLPRWVSTHALTPYYIPSTFPSSRMECSLIDPFHECGPYIAMDLPCLLCHCPLHRWWILLCLNLFQMLADFDVLGFDWACVANISKWIKQRCGIPGSRQQLAGQRATDWKIEVSWLPK